ncbi:hypothetical protein RHRU231_450091 [Rhodococcus ruber]|uniref:Uncharacterized protein n=1 Tax=Rhodococcus ruber TaxID=1830 RepID=A0A098BJK1_9NOCA|nr:hypothetical protein RHRU231_450091 [Rhodococcus ruber]
MHADRAWRRLPCRLTKTAFRCTSGLTSVFPVWFVLVLLLVGVFCARRWHVMLTVSMTGSNPVTCGNDSTNTPKSGRIWPLWVE